MIEMVNFMFGIFYYNKKLPKKKNTFFLPSFLLDVPGPEL